MVQKILTGLAFLAPLAGAADQALLDFIMPDARLVVGIDIAQMRTSPLNASFTNGVQSANPELRKLMDAAGFDPLRDLQELLFASPGIGKNPPALLVAKGSFDVAKLRAFAELAGSKATEFGGVTILSDPEKDKGAFALLDGIILAGNLDQVKAAIERRGHGRVLNTEMATRVAALGQRYDAWLVSIAPLATMASNLPSDAKMEGLTSTEALRSIEQFSLGISLKSDLTFAVEMSMTNAQAAGRMAEGLQMLMAMAKQNVKNEPGMMAALKGVNLGVDQNVVRVGLTVPVDEVEKAVRSAMNPQVKKSAPMTAKSTPAPPPAIQESVAAPEVVPQEHVDVLADTQPEPAAKPKSASSQAKSPRIPANAEIMIQSSPKDMGTVVILGSKK